MAKQSITTKKGDKGTTSLLDNTRVRKHHMRPEVYGTIDEAAAFIGLVRAKTTLEDIKDILLTVQNHLYYINSELACPPDKIHLLKRVIQKRDLEKIEKLSACIEKKLTLPKKFIIYGESVISSYLDIARTVIRRAERRITELDSLEKLNNSMILPYLNRLSDTLYILARYDEFTHKIPYAHPQIKD